MRLIIPRKQERDTKGTQPSVLSVCLFVVADVFHEVFNGDWFLVLIFVPSGAETCLVDEDVGVGG